MGENKYSIEEIIQEYKKNGLFISYEHAISVNYDIKFYGKKLHDLVRNELNENPKAKIKRNWKNRIKNYTNHGH